MCGDGPEAPPADQWRLERGGSCLIRSAGFRFHGVFKQGGVPITGGAFFLCYYSFFDNRAHFELLMHQAATSDRLLCIIFRSIWRNAASPSLTCGVAVLCWKPFVAQLCPLVVKITVVAVKTKLHLLLQFKNNHETNS